MIFPLPATDTALQSALNSCAADGGGEFIIGRGKCMVQTTPIVIPPNVFVRGQGGWNTIIDGSEHDLNTVTLSSAANTNNVGIERLAILGRNDKSATSCALTVPVGTVGHIVRDVIAWFGIVAMYAGGSDGDFDNCYFGEAWGLAAVASNGANWYRRCKIDSTDGYGGPNYVGFYHGAVHDSVCENHLVQCDLSGPYTGGSIFIGDQYPQSITGFTECCMSNGVRIQNHKWTSIGSGCELNGAISNASPNPVSVTGAFAFGPTVVSGAKVVSGCVNIS